MLFRAAGLAEAGLAERLRHRSARRPVEELDGVDDWDGGAARDLRHAADVAGGDEVRLDALDVRDLPGPELSGDLRLEEVVGAGRAAADMALRHVPDCKARLLQELLRLLADLLAVLHRAG